MMTPPSSRRTRRRRSASASASASSALLLAAAILSPSEKTLLLLPGGHALDVIWSCCDDQYDRLTVSKGDPINFKFQGPPSNLYKFNDVNAYQNCNFDAAQFLSPGTGPYSFDTSNVNAGTSLFFAGRNPEYACMMDEWPQKVEIFVEAGLASNGGDIGGQGGTGTGTGGGVGGGTGGGQDNNNGGGVGGGTDNGGTGGGIPTGGGGGGELPDLGGPVDTSDPVCVTEKKTLKKSCKLAFKRKKKFLCNAQHIATADASSHYLGVVNGITSFKSCDKECKVYGGKKSKVNPSDKNNKCFTWQWDNRSGSGECKLYNTVIFKEKAKTDLAKDITVGCGEFKFASKARDPKCRLCNKGWPAVTAWGFRQEEAAPAMSMARPNAEPETATEEATFEKYQGSKCHGNLLGKIETGIEFAETCEKRCVKDETCRGFEYDPTVGGGHCKLLAEEPRRGDDAGSAGHLCAARTSEEA